jgi:hypothetical protein
MAALTLYFNAMVRLAEGIHPLHRSMLRKCIKDARTYLVLQRYGQTRRRNATGQDCTKNVFRSSSKEGSVPDKLPKLFKKPCTSSGRKRGFPADDCVREDIPRFYLVITPLGRANQRP